MNDWDKKRLLRPSEEGQSPIRVSILGDFVLSTASGRQFLIATKKNRALLAILALSPGFQTTRERLCGLLWGDRGEDQARSSLRQSLAVLRKELGQIEELVLKTHDDIVALRMDTVQVDAVEFLALSNDSGITTLRQAARLYRGELLGDTSIRDAAFEDWLSAERSRLRTVAIKVFDRLIPLEEGHSRIVTAQQLVSFDPLRESSHRLLMQAYADQGDNGLALKQFELCRKLLHEELSVEPAAETQALRTAIAKGTLSKAEAPAGASKGEGFERSPAVPDDKPSIAVLPFANLTSDPHQDFLCDRISQNITDDLARFHDLVVIASDSAFVYRNRNASIRAMSQDLGAHYLLQGSVVTSGNHLSIQARLVDGKSGQQVWSESYDGHPDSIFSLQDSVTKTIASTLATAYGGRLLKAWERRADRAATRSMQAIDLFQRGMQSLNRFTREDNETARRLFQEAAQHDPNYAKALAKAAWTHMVDCWFGWSSNPQASLRASLELARKAVTTDPDEPWAYWALSGYYQHEGDFERAMAGYEKALELNPNDADVMTDYGLCLSFAGRAEEGLTMAQRAMRLNPHHPDWYIFQLAQLQFNAKKYRDAVNTTKRLREVETASTQLYLAASYAALGEVKNASMAVTRALELDPQASIERYTSRDMAQYQMVADLDHFRDCLHKAGLPETTNSSLARMDEKPSIAVLPFTNLSGDPQQDYFAEGIAEDIITELGRFSSLTIIGRNSSFKFNGISTTAQTAGTELGADYIVKGSVRKLGQRVRITAELIDEASKRQLWAEHYDREIERLFDVQDEVVGAIVTTTEHRVADMVVDSAARRPPISWAAHDFYLQARKYMNHYETTEKAETLLLRAIDLNPLMAEAYGRLTFVTLSKFWATMDDSLIAIAASYARKGLSINSASSEVHSAMSIACAFQDQMDKALLHASRALALNPNDVLAAVEHAQWQVFSGNFAQGLEELEIVIKRDPIPPTWYWDTKGAALFQLGRYQDSIDSYAMVDRLQSWEMAYIAASLALMGRREEARQQAELLSATAPEITISKILRIERYQTSDAKEHFAKGLRLAGLREFESAFSHRSGSRPAIAVLPFVNLSGDPQQDYLADGLAEDVIAGLSRFSSLVVLSRNSSFRFRGGSVDAKTVGKELGIQYLVAGSLRRVGQLIRVGAQLIDTESGVQLWSEKYERRLEELLEVQDNVVQAIVTTFEHRIADLRASEISHQQASNWAAYDYFLQARQLMSHYSNYAAAEEPLRRAIELDPSFSEAHARLAHVAMSKYWLNGDRNCIEEAFRHAKTAIGLNDRDSAAHTAMSLASAFMNNYDLAFLHADRALELNPNNTQAAKNRAMWQVFVGKSAEALAAFDSILLRDPYPTPNTWEIKGAALFQLHRYEEAIKVFRMIPELQYWDRAYLVASHIRLGNKAETKGELSALLSLHPKISISRVLQTENYADEISRKHLRQALLEAGLPEHSAISDGMSESRSDKPSIAVLPFTNLSSDPEQSYFADGITEDITTELSRFRGLFVIARNSAFSFKAKSVATAAIANKLGVRFLLEGSVRRSGGRVRVIARLVDAETGREAWAERYDRVIEDIFEVQDDVVRTIVATLEGQLASAVANQSGRQTPSNILAYECVLQARKLLDVYDAHSAEPLLRRAIAADPRYAQAHAWMAMVYWVKFFQDHQEKDIAEAVAFGKTAVALDPGDSVCHMQLGFACIFARHLELADIHSQRALELNPADMLALGLRAQWLCRIGRSQEAIDALDQLVRHDPFPPNWYWENRSIVLLTLDKFEDALAAIQHMPELFWWNHGYVAICCARLGRMREAQDAIRHALELRPELTIQRFMMGEPYKLVEDANRMIEGLRMAGLPEHVHVPEAKAGH